MRRSRQQWVLASAAACAAAALSAPAIAQYEAPDPAFAAPAAYYNTATSTVGPTLKAQLNDIIDNHTNSTYDDARDRLQVLDAGPLIPDPGNPSVMVPSVQLVYSGYFVKAAWDAGVTWNREHLWPDSYGVGDPDSGIDFGDLFNLRPCHPGVNSDRGNEYFDNVAVANRMQGHPEAPLTYEDSTLPDTTTTPPPLQMWEPRPIEKGDIARSMFYMDTRYDGADSNTTNLTLTDDISTILATNSNMGRLSTLLKWHYQDGITNAERKRNDQIHDLYQNNRNPFVDRPELVWAIFGGGSNNSRLYVGATNPSNGASSTTATLRIIKGAASWGSANVVINKTGAHPTTYDITTSGSAASTAAGVGQSFDYNPLTRTIPVSLSGGTGAIGTVTGTVTINNTDLTTSGVGSGNGSEDGNDTITVNGTVLDNSQPSFVSGASGTAQSIDFGYVPAGGLIRSATFNVWNNPAPAGAAWTAGLDVDGVNKTGSSLMSTTVTPSNPATPLAANASRAYGANYTPGTAEGIISATHTIATSDENIPGAVARPNLVLTTTGRTTTGGFPVTGTLFLFGGENFVTTSFAVGNGATVTKQGPGTMTIGGAHAHGATASFIADTGGAVNFTTDANSTAASGLAVTVNAAPVTFSSTQHLRALDVQGNATVAQHGNHPLVTGQLTVGATAKLDVKDNDLIVRNGTAGSATAGVYSGIQGKVQSASNGGAWDGFGIVTSMSDAAAGLTSIGVATGEQVLGLGLSDTAVWNGETVSGADVLAMYTYAGDANLDGFISGDDYSAIDGNVSVAGSNGWYNGDFNYDGIVSGDDYATIDSNIVAQGAPLGSSGSVSSAAVVAVPEPAAGLVALLSAPLLLSRRRRRV